MYKKYQSSFILAILAVACIAVLSIVPEPASAATSSAQCWFVPLWLKQFQAVGIKQDSTHDAFVDDCCNIDNSDPKNSYLRRIVTCNAGGWPEIMRWRDELNGTVNAYLVDYLSYPSIYSSSSRTSRKVTIPWVELDLSGNPRLDGTLDLTWHYFGDTLKRLNLSGTSIGGQMGRLDAIFPHLEELDLRGSKISGHLVPMPQTLKVCKLPTTICYYPDWDSSVVPDICIENLPACNGTAPEFSGTPSIPPPLRPHWGDVPLPVTDHRMKPLEEQFILAMDWAEYHGVTVNRTKVLDTVRKTSADLKGQYNMYIWENRGPSLYIRWFRGYISQFNVNCYKNGLTGDINLPANTLSELKGLGDLEMASCNLTGAFPDFVLNMADLGTLQLDNNELSGPVPSLASLESLDSLSLTGNKLGPFGPLQGQSGSCRLLPQRGSKGCWEYDPEFSSPECAERDNKRMGRCNPKEAVFSDAGPWICYYDGCFGGILVRKIKSSNDGETLQCKGPDSETCTYYLDSKCTRERPPNDWSSCGCGRKRLRQAASLQREGKICSPSELESSNACVCPYCVQYWCKWAWRDWDSLTNVTIASSAPSILSPTSTAIVAATTAPTTAPTPSATPLATDAICIRSCADKGNFILARKFNGTSVQCIGPAVDKCSWFSEPSCTLLADGEPAPEASGLTGYVCPQVSVGWCKTARDQLYDGLVASCSLSLSTRTATAVAMSTSRPSGASPRHAYARMILVQVLIVATFALVLL